MRCWKRSELFSQKPIVRFPNCPAASSSALPIARALAANVDLIFADEPTGNLDTATEQEIIRIFKQLAEEFGQDRYRRDALRNSFAVQR